MTDPIRSRGSRRRAGSAMVELGLALSLLMLGLAGTWQFGYSFYAYNTLQSAIRNGARYASLTEYDGGSSNGTAFATRVKNVVVYGKPSPGVDDKPVLSGLTTSAIQVIAQRDTSGVPSRVTVQVQSFSLSTGLSGRFGGFRLQGKPSCTFDYVGRYTVP